MSGKTRAEFKGKFDPAPEVEHLRSKVRDLEQRLADKKLTSGEISEEMAEVRSRVVVAKPPSLLFKPAPAAGSPVVHAVHATDWHIGQKTNPAYIEEFGAFDYSHAVARVGRFGQCIVNKTEAARKAYNVPTCHVIGTADWVSGDIHEELVRTNEFPCPVQAVKAGYLFGSFVLGLAQHFETVEVDVLTAGNHDRITKKNQAEDGGLNSWGYVATEIAKQHLSACANVRFRIHLGLSDIITVGSQRYLIAHGHGIQGTWGIPFYGIERRKQKEAMARMNMPEAKHFDRIVIGHFHTALNHEHWMIGGSLPGTGAFDHEQGRQSRAHQTSWFVHPKHGEFDWTRWWLE